MVTQEFISIFSVLVFSIILSLLFIFSIIATSFSSYTKSFLINCGYGKGYSVQQIVDIFKQIKKNVKIIYQDKRQGDVAEIYANKKKFRNILKWEPKHNDIKKISASTGNNFVYKRAYRTKLIRK